jgi:F0F1-type ATP synthase membrane subunit b/b'
LFLAHKVLRPAIATAVFQRQQRFKKALSEANKARDEAISRQKELAAKLETYEAHLEELKAKTLHQAEEEAHSKVQHAEELALHLREEAAKIAKAEVENARLAMRKQIIEEVKKSVKEKLINELGPEDHARILNQRVAAVLSNVKKSENVIDIEKARAEG